MSLTEPLQFSLLFTTLDLHPLPFPGTGGAVSILISGSALWKQHLMNQDLVLVSQTLALIWASHLLWERVAGLWLCHEAGFHFHFVASLTFDVCWLC